MAIDEQPMNVYWSGRRTETVNKSKINYKGSVTTFSDLPDTNNQKGDMYSVTGLNGENYIWDGTAWDSLGTNDTNVVHKTGDETVGGIKEFTSNVVLVEASAINYICGKPAQGTTYGYRIEVRAAPSTANGGFMSLYGKGHPTSGGNFSLTASRTSTVEDRKSFVGTPDGSLSWDGQAIQTASDERLKTQLAAVSDDVLNAWGDVQWGQFQFLDAVERKGEAARLHLGLIAQRVKAVFEARGLDACAYGILCHEEREATENGSAVDLWMVRYEEALAMEAAYQRRRADRLEARIAALEEKL